MCEFTPARPGRLESDQVRAGCPDLTIPQFILCLTLLLASIGLGVYWCVVAWHISRAKRRVPTCRDGLSLAAAGTLTGSDAPRVCVVIPAHNEAGVVGKLAASLVRQTYPNLRIVFALDRCTDTTAQEIERETGADPRVEIVRIAECPADWAGKVHAVWTAVRTSRGAADAQILLFTDADTEFDPECVRAAAALLRERGLGMLSLMSTLTSDRWFERVAQTAAGMELMRQYPLVRANARQHRRAFANGQFMMFTREAYDAMGGHEAVKHAVLEDMELARLAERRGVPAGLFMADGMLRCRMYADYKEFVHGWKRIYIEAANRRVKRLRQVARRGLLVGVVLPVAGVAAIVAGCVVGVGDALALATVIAGAAGLVIMLAALAWAYRLSQVSVIWTPLYPVGAWQTSMILWGAARDLEKGVPVRWAGREYVREAR